MSSFINLTSNHALITINSHPIKRDELRTIASAIANRTKSSNLKEIAINTDLKAKYLFEFKHYLKEVFTNVQVSITLFINQIIELTDPLEIQQALQTHHHLRLGGHAGIERMRKTMKQIYTWPQMVKDIKKYVSDCSICERAKITRHTRTPMLVTSTADSPFDHVYIDYVGPVNPPSHEGYKGQYIFVATCELTKYSIAAPTFDMTAETTADVYIKHIILQFGTPSTVSHDRGTDFTSALFKKVNKLLNIKQVTTTAYHPQANIVERRNRSTSEYLRCYTHAKPQTWAELLPYCTFAYNITVNETTGYSPFELVYGRVVTLPDTLLRKQPIYNYDNFAQCIKKEFIDAWQIAKENINRKKEKRKAYYDQKVNDINVKVGDKILIKKPSKDKKFELIWRGPYEVTAVPSTKFVMYKNDKQIEDSVSKDRIKLAKANHTIVPNQQLNELAKCVYLIKRDYEMVQ